MRLNNEGKSTSKLWLVGSAVGAVAIAAAASMLMGTPRSTNNTAVSSAAQKANATPGAAHSEDDGHNHAAEGNAATNSAEAASPTSAPSATAATANAAKAPAGKTTVTTPRSAKVRDIQGMKVEDLRVGTGMEAKNGATVAVDYRGTLQDGTVFDESYKRGQTFDFQLPGQVIEGWNLGVVGMKEGGKRRLTIPSELAYGPNGSPPTIPPNATLIFEIELRKVS